MKKLLYIIPLLLVGCSGAERAQMFAIGSPAEVICYSGGKEIYHGRSTGKVEAEKGSDGWFFQEAETKNLIRISGDCLIRN